MGRSFFSKTEVHCFLLEIEDVHLHRRFRRSSVRLAQEFSGVAADCFLAAATENVVFVGCDAAARQADAAKVDSCNGIRRRAFGRFRAVNN